MLHGPRAARAAARARGIMKFDITFILPENLGNHVYRKPSMYANLLCMCVGGFAPTGLIYT